MYDTAIEDKNGFNTYVRVRACVSLSLLLLLWYVYVTAIEDKNGCYSSY